MYCLFFNLFLFLFLNWPGQKAVGGKDECRTVIRHELGLLLMEGEYQHGAI